MTGVLILQLTIYVNITLLINVDLSINIIMVFRMFKSLKYYLKLDILIFQIESIL